MRERLHAIVEGRGAGMPAAELLDLVFEGGGNDTDFGRAFLRSLLQGDPRFREDEDGLWHPVDDHLFDRDTSEAAYVVVDLETTGQRTDDHGVTEIGAIRLHGEVEVGRFESLVNPGSPIPSFVTSLTGISDAMVADAPSLDDVLGPFVDFADGAVLVAHNAAFDAQLLDREARRVLDRSLAMPTLCTVRLAQSLMPELKKTSLDSLSEHLGLEASGRHRAMGDAEATAGFLRHFMKLLREKDRPTVGDMVAAQDVDHVRRYPHIAIAQRDLEELTEGPGVYLMLDADGNTLFVGRSTALRSEVTRRFLEADHASDRQCQMLTATQRIESIACGSTLHAQLVEAREIRRRDPAYNRSGRHMPRANFVRVSRGRFPRVSSSTRVIPDGSQYIGPLRGRGFANEAAELLAAAFGVRTCKGRLTPDPTFEACELKEQGWCASPCDATIDGAEYDRRIGELIDCLANGGDGLKERYDALRSAGSSARRLAAAMRRISRHRREGSWLVGAESYLAVAAGAAEPYFVVAVVEGAVVWDGEVPELAGLAATVTQAAEAVGRRRNTVDDADASTILAWWRRGDGSDDSVCWAPFEAGNADSIETALAAAAVALND